VYYIYTKDKNLITAARKSDFADALKDVKPNDIDKVFEGVEVEFRFQSLPVVTRPPAAHPRKKSTE
jgi:hypothetical protein